MKHKHHGFTIVELLIVIVIIGVLAAVSVVAYNSMQRRAKEATLQSDLRQAKTYLDTKKVETGAYPALNTIPKSQNTAFELTAQEQSYCLTATMPQTTPYHISSNSGVTKNPCPGHEFGGPAPAGENIIAPVNQWTFTGGASASDDILTIPLHMGTTHSATAPLMRVDGASSMMVTYEIRGGANRPVWSSFYKASDKVTSVTNINGQSNNGASAVAPNSPDWQPRNFMFHLGPNVQYVQLWVAAEGTYLGDVDIRNVVVKLTR